MTATRWQHHPAYDGAFVRYHADPDGLVREFYQDAEPVIDAAKWMAEADRDRNFVGSVPVVTYYDWMIEAQRKGEWEPGQDGQLLNRFITKKLREFDYKKFTGR